MPEVQKSWSHLLVRMPGENLKQKEKILMNLRQ